MAGCDEAARGREGIIVLDAEPRPAETRRRHDDLLLGRVADRARDGVSDRGGDVHMPAVCAAVGARAGDVDGLDAQGDGEVTIDQDA